MAAFIEKYYSVMRCIVENTTHFYTKKQTEVPLHTETPSRCLASSLTGLGTGK